MHELTDSLERWARIVTEIEHGYALTFDDYLNDLDLRHTLRAITTEHPLHKELAAVDARFREATFPSGSCVWGEENADAEAWDREAHWYYWRLPTHPGPAFHDE